MTVVGDPAPASQDMPLRVMFVDDEANVLSGLERLLRPMRRQWEMRFCPGGAQALQSLAVQPADILISDMRMPGMTGGELLAEVMRRWPATTRVILSGQADRVMIHQTIGPAHQFLAKPCDPDHVQGMIGRIWRLRRAIANSTVHALVGGMTSLPSLPERYDHLMQLLHDDRTEAAALADHVGADPGMAARVLQLLNSAFFGGRHILADPRDAARRLGMETLRALAASPQAFSRLETGSQVWFDPGGMWGHSIRVARLARRIAQDMGLDADRVQVAETAGLLHDAGHMLLAGHRPKEFVILSRRVGQEGDVHGERLVLGCTHGEIGAYLLGLWGLPDGIVEAVNWHHEPGRCPAEHGPVATAVHVADALDSLRAAGPGGIDRLAHAHVASLDLTRHLDTWRGMVEPAAART